MKKLLVVLAVAVSGVVAGQDDSLIGSMLDAMRQQQELINITYDNTYMPYKYGDTDAPGAIGILKTIFDDDISRYKYRQINPRIPKLIIPNADWDTVISFEDWLDTVAGITNFEKYIGPRNNFRLKYSIIGNQESLTVIDNTTNNWIFYIVIFYDKFENVSADNWINLGSIDIIYNKNGER